MKKLLSVAISFVMAVSVLAVPVFADDTSVNGTAVETSLAEQSTAETASEAVTEDVNLQAEQETVITDSEDETAKTDNENAADDVSGETEEKTSDEVSDTETSIIVSEDSEALDEAVPTENISGDEAYSITGPENAEDQQLILTEDSAQAANASASAYDVNVTVTKCYAEAYKMIAMVNSLRSSLGRGGLTVDNDLTEAAMQRAAEISVSFSHERPNGTMCDTVISKLAGENIAAGYASAEDTYNQWYNSSGHYSNMVNSEYNSIGIGCAYVNGHYFWVQIFAWDEGSGTCCTTDKNNVSVKVSVANDCATLDFANSADFTFDSNGNPNYLYTLTRDDDNINIDAGKSFYLNAGLKNPGWYYHTCIFNPDSFTWKSSNSKVAKVECSANGCIVTALKSGTATITATTSSGQSISTKVVVNKGPAVLSASGSGSTRTLTLSDADSSLTSVKVAVWSSTDGQDDLVWYQMTKKSDDTWKVKVKNINLFDSGVINAHAYSGSTFIAATTYNASTSDIAKTKPTVSGSGKTRTVTMPLAYSDYSELSVRIYSKTNSWDDLTAYTMQKQSDGSWMALVNNTKLNDYGTVYVRVYSGSKYIAGTSYKVKESEITLTKPTIKGSGTKRTITLTSDYSGFGTLKVGVWSKENGQDDIRWYTMKKQSDGLYKATIKMSNIYSAGKAYAHVYAGSTYVTGTTFTVKASDMTAKSIKVTGTGTTRTITVTGAGGLRNLKAAVWSKANGQDDLTWSTMTRNSDGTWTVKYKTSNLKNKGTVYVHVYSGSTYVNGCSIKVK